MHHGVDFRAANLIVEPVTIQQIPFEEPREGMDGGPMAVPQVVERHDGVPLLDEPFGYDAADIAGCAGDKDIHGWSDLARRLIATDVPVTDGCGGAAQVIS